MVLRNSGNSPIEIFERLIGKSVDGATAPRVDGQRGETWRETVTRNLPETSLAIRLLQARITALDPMQDEDILELSEEAA